MALPTVVTIDGLQPQSTTDLNAQLIAAVTAEVPGYTANLPGSMIEDMSSTDTAAISLCDQARVELVNSMTPYGANQFVLNQLGVQAGIPPNTPTNTSVYVDFTGTVGFPVGTGFVVSDGMNQYVVQDPFIIPTGGTQNGVYCVSTTSGVFAVPENTVTQLVTSVPNTITLTCTNPSAGIPSTGSETVDSYRARVIQAQSSTAQGMTTNLRTQLQKVPGVQQRLITVRQQSPGWQVIVGGGDPYAVANAIWLGLFDISSLQGSSLSITGMTNANPVVVTTNLDHNLQPGQTFTVINATPTGFNTTYTVNSVTATTITTTTNGSGFGTYTGGAQFSPNPRNQTITVYDYPDQYVVTYVVPPSETVTVNVTWNTTATNIVSDNAVAQAIIPAVVNYVNALYVGQYINTAMVDSAIQAAISTLFNPQLLDRLVYAWEINGVPVTPVSGTTQIVGDPESYFTMTQANVTVVRG